MLPQHPEATTKSTNSYKLDIVNPHTRTTRHLKEIGILILFRRRIRHLFLLKLVYFSVLLIQLILNVLLVNFKNILGPINRLAIRYLYKFAVLR